MCLNCGCNEPNNSHGDDRNITFDDLMEAGSANGQNIYQTISNLLYTVGASLKRLEKDPTVIAPEEKLV